MASVTHFPKKSKRQPRTFSNPEEMSESQWNKKNLLNQRIFEEYYTQFYEEAPIGYYTLDENDIIFDVNYLGAALLGVNKEGIVKKSFTRYIAADYQFIFSDFKKRILSSRSVQACELKLFKKNGPLIYAQIEGKILFEKMSEKKKILLIVNEVNNHKYEQNNKYFSHTFHSSPNNYSLTLVAHELTHPHAVIGNYIHGTLNRLEKNNYKKEELIHSLRQVLKQLDRAYEIMLCMENYVCKGSLSFELVNIDSLIKEALNNFQAEMHDFAMAIEYRPLKRDLFVHGDSIHIQQVILHLARNAMEAMKEDGTIAPRLIISVSLVNQNNIQISMIDNGAGVDANLLSRLFSPHFSTKNYGVGLGLVISRKIIESHQGSLTYEPNFPRGTCFKIILPIKEMINETEMISR